MADRDAVDVIRSEEQLQVRTVSVPRSRLRVRTVIVTEERTVTVTIRREELRIDEEPPLASGTDDAAADGHSGVVGDDDDLTLVLRAEEIVVTKRIVPVERVRVAKRRVTVDTPVTASVRRERVDVQEDGRPGPAAASGPSTAGGSNESGVASPRRPEDQRS